MDDVCVIKNKDRTLKHGQQQKNNLPNECLRPSLGRQKRANLELEMGLKKIQNVLFCKVFFKFIRHELAKNVYFCLLLLLLLLLLLPQPELLTSAAATAVGAHFPAADIFTIFPEAFAVVGLL